MVEFLREAIAKKEDDLLCPVCLEPAKVPIFSCPDSHIICSTCVPKLKSQECPQCRVRLPESLRRDRFAEKTAKEYEELLQRLSNLSGEGKSGNQMEVEQNVEEGERGACGGLEPENKGKAKGKRQRGTPIEIEVSLPPFRQCHKSYDHISRSYGPEWILLQRAEIRNQREINVEIPTQAEASKLNSNFGLKMDCSKSVFVGNLPHFAVEADLFVTFSVFGEVAKVEINRDMEKLQATESLKKKANFGFVEFYSKESVDEALKSQQRSLIRLRSHESGDELFDSELFVERKFNASESDI